MRIVFFDCEEHDRQNLYKFFPQAETIEFVNESLSAENAAEFADAEIISVFIYSEVTKDVLDLLPNLKLVTTRSTGYDHIDLVECKKRNIAAANVPFYGENTVAEHTFALILSLSRNVHKSYMRTLQGDFSIKGLEGFDLKGKTLGVIGAGRIGLHVIRIAKGFGMHVKAFDVKKDTFMAEVMGFEYAEINDILQCSDIITLHVPYNAHTHHLINKERIGYIKKGAILINTARGAVVDTDALLEALEKNILSGAGLDVLEGEEFIREDKELLREKGNTKALETLSRDDMIMKMENVVFTPHIGFYSKEALERIIQTTSETIQSFYDGKLINTL
ncbi:MAG: hydroxyacid dehydrogenase [Candidatus Gracilibacteria bacterium]